MEVVCADYDFTVIRLDEKVELQYMVKQGGEREKIAKKERDRDARFKRFIDASEAGEHLDRLGSIRRELKMLPPGRLEALQQHGRIYYYQNAQARRRGSLGNRNWCDNWPESGTCWRNGRFCSII